MAIGTGRDNSVVSENNGGNGGSFSKWIGVVPFTLVAINPNVEKLKEIYPWRKEIKEPKYTWTKEGGASGVRVVLYMQTDPEVTGGNTITVPVTYMISDESRKSAAGNCEYINAYGDSAWMSEAEFAAKSAAKFPAYNFEGARLAKNGEVMLMTVIRKFVGIPMSQNWDSATEKWTAKTAAELAEVDCSCQLEVAQMAAVLKGDVSSIANCFASQPNNKIKFPLGLKPITNDKGTNEVQEVLAECPISNNATVGRIPAAVDKAKAANSSRYASHNFGESPYTATEWAPEPTHIGGDTTSDLPF